MNNCARFQLNNGQFFAEYSHKNLQWFLNGEYFGFGDLRALDIQRICCLLEEGETFEGYNEHHGTEWQQRENPVIVIGPGRVLRPGAIR